MDTTAPQTEHFALPENKSRTRLVLDLVHDELLRQPHAVGRALDALSAELHAAKRDLSAREWDRTVTECRVHPLRALLHQDPLTARAFAMSRGYQGDAELLDIIYSREFKPHWSTPVSPLGNAIFHYTIDCQAPAAVRERRTFLASQIDDCCAGNPAAQILSVACGHLRELEVSQAIRARAFGRFVGLDQDQATLAHVERTWGGLGVEAQPASITAFLSYMVARERFDFIYAAGLYDYLDDSLAQLVTRKLFDMLEPGGRLLIGNYTPDTRDAGYMEAFMGWRLLYRDARAMHRLAATINTDRIADATTTSDNTGAVIYLDLKAR